MERHVLPMNVYYANFRLMKKLLLSTCFGILAFTFFQLPVYAVQNDQGLGSSFQDDNGTAAGSVTIPNPLQVNSITELFVALLEVLLIFAVPIVVFFIILAGFRYVTARGDTNTITEAHRALLYAVIGGVLILGANLLIQVIQATVTAVAN